MKKIIFLIALIFSYWQVSAWASDKTPSLKPEPAPVKEVSQSPTAPAVFQLPWTSLNGGGDVSISSTNYKAKTTTSQSVIGESQSTNYQMGIGFWYGPGIYCLAKAGDADADNGFTLADVIAIVNYIFKKAGWPACSDNNYTCWLHALTCRGDWNAIDGVNLADVIRAVNYIFKKSGWPACPANNYTCWLPPATGVCCLPVP